MGSSRIFWITSSLCLISSAAWAGPAECERALAEENVRGIERDCAYARNSKDGSSRKLYYFVLGNTYALKFIGGDRSAFPKAIDNLSEAIAIAAKGPRSAEDAKIYQMRGTIYLQNKEPGSIVSKDIDKALSDFSSAISLNPKDAQSYLYRGYAHNQRLRPEAAWADFQQAKTLDPSDSAIHSAWEKQRNFMKSTSGK